MRDEQKTLRRAAWVICAAGGVVGGWVAIRFILPLAAPFLIAWLLALFLDPLAEKMKERTHIPRRLCAVILLTLTLLLLALLVTLGINRLIFELQRLLDWLSRDGGRRITAVIGEITDRFNTFRASFPFLHFLWSNEELTGLWSGIDEIASGVISDTVSEISAAIPAMIASLLRALPGAMLFFGVWLIACFYFCLDLRAIHAAISVLLPDAWRVRVPALRRRAAVTALRWMRAYLLLLLLTFLELLIGFSLLGLEYAFLLALVIALVDLMPVFGVGTVMIPWAVVLLIGGNYYLGFGVLIIYAVIAVIRQIAEPRIVGSSIGLHPLLTLASLYVGLKLFGIAGMLAAPAAALALGLIVGGARETEKEARVKKL